MHAKGSGAFGVFEDVSAYTKAALLQPGVKIWPHGDYPLIKVGTMTLNKNPDKMLQGRVFAYSDTHRYRIGHTYQQLPVNRHRVEGAYTYQFDGRGRRRPAGRHPGAGGLGRRRPRAGRRSRSWCTRASPTTGPPRRSPSAAA